MDHNGVCTEAVRVTLWLVPGKPYEDTHSNTYPPLLIFLTINYDDITL